MEYQMKDKQLDFSQPFLSVRRFSPTLSSTERENRRKDNDQKLPTLPVYKSEMKTGPVSNPGSVPFVWEQIPGMPKYENKPQMRTPKRPPGAPKLPPGNTSTTTRLPATHSLSNRQHMTSVGKEESSRLKMEETRSCTSDDTDESYVDAVDTLSRTESFFYNCSLTGISGLDAPDLKPSGAFSTDQQIRDIMMNRFLPAAKAVASETPEYSSYRKPRVAPEQPELIKGTIIKPRKRTADQNMLISVPYNYYQGNEVEDSEDDDDGSDGLHNSSPGVCGLFPRLCLQSSFFLLNPVPGIRKPAQPPNSSVRKTKVRSSNAASCTTVENKNHTHPIYEPRPTDRLQPTGVYEYKNELKRASNQIRYTRDLREVDPCPPPKVVRNLQELLSSEMNELESKYLGPVVEKTLYIDTVHRVTPQTSNSISSDMEILASYKKVDADTLIKASEIEEMDSTGSVNDFKFLDAVDGQMKVVAGSLESVDSGFLSLSDRSFHDVQMDKMDNCGPIKTLEQGLLTSTSPKVDKSGIKNRLDIDAAGNLESSPALIHDPIVVTRDKVADDGKINMKCQLSTELSNQMGEMHCHPLLPLPPPLPNSPSESWLMRTLPAASSKNFSARSSLLMRASPKIQASKKDIADLKWENIVKSSNGHGHSRFSEEVLAPIPEA